MRTKSARHARVDLWLDRVETRALDAECRRTGQTRTAVMRQFVRRLLTGSERSLIEVQKKAS